MATSAVVSLVPGVAHAAATASLGNKVADLSAAQPGSVITYTINYSCSGTVIGDTCAGATFSDPLPNFQTIDGVTVEPTLVTAVFPAQPGSGGHWDGASVQQVADPAEPASPSFPAGGTRVVATADADFVAGASGLIYISVRIPLGVVPPSVQTLANTATITLGGTSDPSTTANTTLQGAAPHWVLTKSGPATARTNRSVSYTIRACPQPVTAAVWPQFTISDALPEGAEFLSATAGGTYSGDLIADGVADEVTWSFDSSNRPALDGSGCFSVQVSVRYPTSPPAPSGPAETNIGDATKTDTATGTGSDGSGGSEDLGPAQVTTTLLGPQVTFSVSKNAGGEYYVQDGDTVTFNLGLTNDSDLPLDELRLVDGPLPAPFQLDAVHTGTWGDGAAATVQGSVDGVNWTDIATGLDGTSNTTVATGLGSYRWVRWVFAGPVPLDLSVNGASLVGTVNGTESATPYQNCVDGFGDRDSLTVDTANSCASFVLETPRPHPGITKDASPTLIYPGEASTYSIVVRNDGDATGDLVDPIVRDCLPAPLVYQAGSFTGSGWTVLGTSTSQPGCTGTYVELQYSGTLQPGDTAPTITYDSLAPGFDENDLGAIAAAGSYVNTARVRMSDGSAPTHCIGGACQDSATVTVPAIATLNSEKLVRGALDSGFGYLGQTQPGTVVTWRLTLRNEGNVAGENVQYVDVLPYIGDTGVIRTDQERGTEYRPYLVSAVSAPVGWVIEYSTSSNPCRPEVGGPSSGCDAPNWSTDTSVWVLPTYRSVRFSYLGTNPSDPAANDIGRGQAFSFEWDMRAPVYDPTYDKGGSDTTDPYEYLTGCNATSPRTDGVHCPTAVNSFAYGVDPVLPVGIPDPGRLTAEPPAVEVRVSALPEPNGIGDRVWYDHDYDGVQDAGETGVPYAYVQLWKYDGVLDVWDLHGFTYTDENGNYLFSELPDGVWKVRFYPPPGWEVSPADSTGASGDSNQTNPLDDHDSDALGSTPGAYPVPLGTDSIGAYYETTSVTLGAGNEIDLGWDMGLWEGEPSIQVVKVTKDTAWADSSAGDGVSIIQGRPVTWIYTVTNTGNSRLQNVNLVDDNGTAGNSGDDFAVTSCVVVDDGHNASGLPSSATAPMAMNRGAIFECRATGTARRTNYSNVATVSGNPTLDDGTPNGSPVSDTDPSSYVSGKYDLALAKTVTTTNLLSQGTAVFTITVRNEGTVASGAYDVTDLLPTGVSLVGNATPVQTSSAGGTIVWANRPSLAPGTNATFTFTVQVDDWKSRPWRNIAEISADSSASVVTGGVPTPTTDSDSTPDANPSNDNTNYGPIGTPNANADNANITQAGSSAHPDAGDDPQDGEDDADIADMAPVVRYDVALAKVAEPSPVRNPDLAVFKVRVYNDGNVQTRNVTVLDHLPSGLTYVDASSDSRCDLLSPGVVQCAITNIAVGASTDLTIAATIADWSSGPWRNWAEVDTDSAQSVYGVNDADSQPESAEADGIGQDDTLPGDPYAGVPALTTTYTSPGGGDEDDNDDAIVGSYVSVGDYVWLDVDRDGRQDDPADEPPIQGVTVRLYASNGTTLLGTTTTDANGFYSFVDLLPATAYVIQFVPPAGDGFTLRYASGGTAGDSNANPADGRAPFTTGNSGLNSAVTPDDPTIDAGLVRVDLTLDKTLDTAGPYHAGKSVQFTLTPHNIGTTDALAGWYVTDVLPAGLTLVSMEGAAGPSSDWLCAGASCINSATLAAGGTAESIVVTATIDTGVVGPLRNVAYVGPAPTEVVEVVPLGTPPTSSTDTGTSPTNNDDHVDLTVDEYDLALAKTADASSVTFGQTVTYTITIANQGTVPSGDYAVRDVLPLGLTQSGAISNGGTYDGGTRTITWNLAGLAAGATTTVSYSVQVTDLGYRPWRNIAEISSDDSVPYGGDVDSTPDTVLDNDGDYDSPGVDNSNIGQAGNGSDPEDDADVAVLTNADTYDLALAKIADTTAVDDLGAAINYTITVRNQGSVSSQAYVVVDTLPQGLAAPTSISDGGVWSAANRSITWNLPDMAAGATNTLTYTTTVTDLPMAPWRNFAEITVDGAGHYGLSDVDSTPGGGTELEGTDNTGANAIAQAGVGGDTGYDDQDIAVVTSGAVYDLALAKTGAVNGSGDAATVDFTVTVQNQGTLNSQEYTVLDIVPDGLVVDESSISNGGLYDSASHTITWTLDNLAATATLDLTWSATIGDLSLRPYRNHAEISSDGSAFYGYTDIDSTPDGDSTNDTGALTYDDPGVDNGSIAEAGNGNDPEDDADIAQVDVPLTYDLALAKVASAPTFAADGTVTFSITVRNQGDVASGDYTVTDTLPPGMAAVSASDGGDITVAGVVTWDLTGLAAGADRTITVVARVTDPAQRPFENIAEISADGADGYDAPNPDASYPDVEDVDSSPDTDTENDNGAPSGDGYGTIEAPANDLADVADVDGVPNGEDDADVAFVDTVVLYDLALVKTGPATIDGAGNATFTILVLNQGNVPSGPVTVDDTVPAGLSPVSATSGGTIAGNQVTWTLASLAPGASVGVSVTVRVTDYATRPWVNVAAITADGADAYDSTGYLDPAAGDVEDDDSVPGSTTDALVDQTALPTDQYNDPSVDEDDHDVAPIDVTIRYDLALVKSVPAGQSYKVGSPIRFEVRVMNQGNVPSGPVTVLDTLPGGMSFVSADHGGLASGTNVTWDLPNLAPGEIVVLTVTARMDDIHRTAYVNLAEIVADGADAYDLPGQDVEDEDSTPDADLANDPLVDTDDVTVDQLQGDEDDHDRALLDVTKVASDNPDSGLPTTGGDVLRVLGWATLLLGAGAIGVVVARRRRRPA